MTEILTNGYFTGCGLFDEGLSRGGLTMQQSFEIDEDAVAVARANAKHEVVLCDITKKLVKHEKRCHVRAFTYPCTRYCDIAEIHGTRTGDDLYLHALRHMVIDPPEVYIAENVPGMKMFPVVMEVMTKLPGYYVNVFCPVRTQTWLPQKRDRLIIIGSRKNFLWREPQSHTRVSLRDIIEDDPQVEIPDYVYTRLKGGYRDRPIISDPARDDLAPTCVAHYSKDVSTRLVADKRFPHGVRPWTVREWARLQGVPDTFQFPTTARKAFKMIGNGVPVPMGEWIGGEVVRYFKN